MPEWLEYLVNLFELFEVISFSESCNIVRKDRKSLKTENAKQFGCKDGSGVKMGTLR